jgi:ADP-heptose:LPS heptosyltransferase
VLLKKILIIRFSSIGDIVLTSPVIRCLKKQVKGVEIHYLTKKVFAGILENNPYVDKVHVIETAVAEVLDELKNEKFDCIVDLHRNLRSVQVKRMLKVRSFSFQKLNYEKWLLVNLKVNRLPAVHIVDRYLETVRFLGVENDGLGLDYFIPAADEVDVGDLPHSFRSGYLGFVIGAAHATKRLETEKIISVCRKLGRPVVLLGGKDEAEAANQIVEAIGPMVYNACGKYNLNQSASLIRQAREIVTHDTGLMHIAAAFQKSIVSVWGNTVPEFGMFPYLATSEERAANRGELSIKSGKSEIVEVKGLSCRPCSKIGYKKCPKGHFKCMRTISEEELISKIKLLAP